MGIDQSGGELACLVNSKLGRSLAIHRCNCEASPSTYSAIKKVPLFFGEGLALFGNSFCSPSFA